MSGTVCFFVNIYATGNMSQKLTFAFFLVGFLVFVGADTSWTSESSFADPLDSSSETVSGFCGLYVLSLQSSESDSVQLASVNDYV
jgi:hypothetical protein